MLSVHLNCESDSFRPYWSPESEPYAPAEVLLRYLQDKWEPDNSVIVKRVYHTRGRYSEVYCFLLRRKGEIIQMPVIGSPAVSRVLSTYQLLWIEESDRMILEGETDDL